MEPSSNTTESNSPAASSTPVTSPQPAAEAAHEHRTLMAVLAYFGILVIVPYLVAKEDSFVRFHVRQGAVLALIWIAIWVVGGMVWMLYPLISIINLALIILSIIGIINAVQGKEVELPITGGLAKHIKI